MCHTSSRVVERHIPCPSSECGSSDAYCTYDDGHGYCFSCKKTFKTDKPSILINPRTFDLNQDYTYEFLPWRGVTKDTFKFFGCKTKINYEGQPVALGFQYPNNAYKVRLLGKKEFYSEGDMSSPNLFGMDKFAAGSHRCITITEGELDACSLYQVCRSPCVSVRSASSAATDCAAAREYLNSFETVCLALDADQPGLRAAAEVARLFDFNKVVQVKFSNRKDANAYLEAGEDEVLKTLWTNARRYQPETVISALSDFDDIITKEKRKGVPYPFHTLNEMTYGIRTGESVLITAMEGVGKTELMHAIEYQLLRETNEPIASLFLEEPKDRHLLALAGLQGGQAVHLPDRYPGDETVKSWLREVVGRDDRLFVYNHFGSDSPDLLLDTVRYLVSACGCRYVLLDHISIAVSGASSEKDERRQLDYLSTRLEMMVKELDFALIFVSHVNDDGLTRGSRNISKIADIRIDAVRDLLAADPVVRNTTVLTVSKNRPMGKTGFGGKIIFDPDTSRYSEEREFAQAGV